MKDVIYYPNCVFFPKCWDRRKCELWAIERDFDEFNVSSNGERMVLLYNTLEWYNYAF